MRLFLILILSFLSFNFCVAQNVSPDDFPIYDLKAWSHSQTNQIFKESGKNLTEKQSASIYTANLNVIRKIFDINGGNITANNWEKNKKICETILNQRENVYKQVLTTEQYEKHLNALKRMSANVVNANIVVSTSGTNNISDKATNTYPSN